MVEEEAAPAAPRRRAALTLVVALLLAASLAMAAWLVTRSEGPSPCPAGLAVGDVDGRVVALQDQGPPGRDGCDGDEVPQPGQGIDLGDGPEVLGFDCRVRTADGSVVATTAPNRDDGTCGQPDP